MPITTGGVVNYNQKFIDVMENFDTFLQERVRKHPQIWVDRIPKGTLTNFEGLTRKSNIFHGGLGEQAGLSNWSQIQISRAPSGTDQGYDACNYDPETFTYSYESVQYTGYRCSWQSDPVCVNDIRFTAEARMQCQMITSQMAYVTQSVWENWNREQYVKMAINGGHAMILSDQGLDFADSPTYAFTYDAYTADADDDFVLTFPLKAKLSTLNWSFFDQWQDYLGDQCPEAAISNMDGLPVFGLMIHKRDFDRMIQSDDDLREDIRYADSRVLIQDYRSFKEFKGWALIHDSRQMRFKVKKTTSTTVTAKRVLPMKLGKTVTIGQLPTANIDYTNAEIAVGVIFMNEVMQNLVPQPLTNAGGGMLYGPVPGYDGKFMWINEYDRELNPLKEVGYFFARFEAFPKPLMYSGEAIVFLYLRAPQTWQTEVEVENRSDASAGPLAIITNAVTADVDRTNFTVTARLAGFLAAGVGDAVTCSYGSATCYIADASKAPLYTFVYTSDPGAYTNFTTSVTFTVA